MEDCKSDSSYDNIVQEDYENSISQEKVTDIEDVLNQPIENPVEKVTDIEDLLNKPIENPEEKVTDIEDVLNQPIENPEEKIIYIYRRRRRVKSTY